MKRSLVLKWSPSRHLCGNCRNLYAVHANVVDAVHALSLLPESNRLHFKSITPQLIPPQSGNYVNYIVCSYINSLPCSLWSFLNRSNRFLGYVSPLHECSLCSSICVTYNKHLQTSNYKLWGEF